MKAYVFGITDDKRIEVIARKIKEKLQASNIDNNVEVVFTPVSKSKASKGVESAEIESIKKLSQVLKEVQKCDCVVFPTLFPTRPLMLQVYEILKHFKFPMFYETDNGIISEPLDSWFKVPKIEY